VNIFPGFSTSLRHNRVDLSYLRQAFKVGSHSRVTPTFVLVCSLVTGCYSNLYFWKAPVTKQ